MDDVRRILEDVDAIAYALVFGSTGRGSAHARSDVDLALELRPGAARDPMSLGQLAARLESAAGRAVDVVLMEDAPPPLAYRIFRDGRVLLERDRDALVQRKARAILDYLDFKPVEAQCTDGVLRAAADHG